MGTSPWEPLLGNLYLGTTIREPGGMGFGAAPLCSENFTMAEDPSSLRCWGIKHGKAQKIDIPGCFCAVKIQDSKHVMRTGRVRIVGVG